MVILGIETSCDETACAVLIKNKERITILSNIVASSAPLQAKYGGVIPEQAAREQIKSIIPVIEEALIQSNLYPPSSKHHLPSSIIHPPAIDAIAVTSGPGLIGSLLVGVETAKTLSLIWEKPLIQVNHLLGHFYANWIGEKIPSFTCVGLLVSGGHTDLVLFKDHGKYLYLGGTRDDAAGECFDKCARLLSLPYPGGSEIAKLALKGDPNAFDLPRPMLEKGGWDFSFSGLKTAVANLIVARGDGEKGIPTRSRSERSRARMHGGISSRQDPERMGRDELANLAASIEQAIIDVLIVKTIKAVQVYKVNQIMIAGGVASNQKLTRELKLKIKNLKLKITLHVPPPYLCTDNAAMIAAAAFFLPRGKAGQKPTSDPLSIQVDPNLALTP